LLHQRQPFPVCVGRCTQDTCNSFGIFSSTTQKLPFVPPVCVCDVRFAVYPHRLPRCPAMMMSSIRSPNIRRKQSKRQLLANTFSSHPSGCLVQAQKKNNKNKIKERRISDVFICCHLFFFAVVSNILRTKSMTIGNIISLAAGVSGVSSLIFFSFRCFG